MGNEITNKDEVKEDNSELASNNSSKSFDEILIELNWKILENQYNRFKDIDTKAIATITVSGVLITFLTRSSNDNCLTIPFFILTMVSFLITILLGINVVKTRNYEGIPTESLIKLSESMEYKKKDKIGITAGTIAATEKTMRDAANAKAEDLKISIYGLGYSIILLIIYSILSHSLI
jgi:hypothetical protein